MAQVDYDREESSLEESEEVEWGKTIAIYILHGVTTSQHVGTAHPTATPLILLYDAPPRGCLGTPEPSWAPSPPGPSSYRCPGLLHPGSCRVYSTYCREKQQRTGSLQPCLSLVWPCGLSMQDDVLGHTGGSRRCACSVVTTPGIRIQPPHVFSDPILEYIHDSHYCTTGIPATPCV